MRDITDIERNEADYYLRIKEDSLWISIGYASQPEGTAFSQATAKKEGELWYESVREELRTIVCCKWNYPSKRKELMKCDRATLVIQLGEVLCSLTLGVPLVALSALVVRMGLDTLCDCGHGKTEVSDG